MLNCQHLRLNSDHKEVLVLTSNLYFEFVAEVKLFPAGLLSQTYKLVRDDSSLRKHLPPELVVVGDL